MSAKCDKCTRMMWPLTSSVGKKQVMAITGLLLSGFLFTHLLGNFLLLAGAETFNFYAHKLVSNPLIYVAEFILAMIFLSHVGLALKLTIENNNARPVKYYVRTKTGKGATLASSSMPYTGMIILVFIIAHLLNFKFGSYYTANYDGVEIRNIYQTVIEYFQNPFYVTWYVFAMFAIGFHLGHGFQSAFQSLGINHPTYTPLIKKAGTAYALLIGFGFAFLSVWCHFQNV